MPPLNLPATFALLLSAVLLSGSVTRQPDQSPLDSANALFKAGKFAEAEKRYTQVVAQDPSHYQATARLGYLALLANRLDDAQKWLQKAIELRPNEATPKALLAEAYYRRDEFAKAAPLLRAIKQEGRAKQLASFEGQKPYEVQGQGDRTSVKFVMTDPLPLVRVRVNGGPEVHFFLDTGAPEVILDTEFAKELGVRQFGSLEGSFAGSKKSSVGYGRIDTLALGDWVVKNVPVVVLNTRQFSKPVFGGKRVDGAIGTVLFYHFLATLDYPKGELTLRRRSKESLKQVEGDRPGQTVAIPFWMAGDHFMVAWGRIEKGEPVLLFVDTGAAGVGVVLAESAIKAAGIKLLEGQAGEGVGGGGKVRVVPFVVKELSLGDVTERNVRGTFHGPFAFEHTFGFRLAGLISHSFFRPYALTFDFDGMRLILKREP